MLLSVVIPLFNKERSVARAIESVLHQSHDEWELVIVDDGSTDRSGREAAAYLSHRRISIVRQDNAGVSAARNSGVLASRGDYVCFLDADDEWSPNHLANLASLIRLNPAAVLFTAKSMRVDESGQFSLPRGEDEPAYPGKLDDFFETYRRCSLVVNSSSACVPRHAFNAMGGFPNGKTTGEDVYVWFRLAGMGDVMFCPEPSVTVHLDGENRSAARKNPLLPYQIEYFLDEGRIVDFPDWQRTQALKALLRSALLNCAGASLGGNRRLAFAYLRPVAKYSLFSAAAVAVIAVAPKPVLKCAQAYRRRSTSRSEAR